MTVYYVGMDVHAKKTQFAVEDEKGSLVAEGEIFTTMLGLREMKERLGLPEGTQVGLETGTVSFFVARQLKELGLEPIVIDAHEVRIKAHRPNQKSDRRDAREICVGVRTGMYRSIVHVPPPEISTLRETLSRRRHFVRIRTSEVNAVKRLLRSAGLAEMSRELSREAGWKKLLGMLPAESELRAHVERHLALWRCAVEQVASLDGSLDKQAPAFESQEKLLTSIDGVGRIVALTAIAVLSDVKRFKSAKHVGSYVGLVPSTYQSGDRDAHGRITKRGSGELRSMLDQAAQHARREGHPLYPFFARLCAKRGHKQAVMAIAHRLARIMFAMLRDGVPFDPLKAGVERGPFETRKVKVYRIKPFTPPSRTPRNAA